MHGQNTVSIKVVGFTFYQMNLFQQILFIVLTNIFPQKCIKSNNDFFRKQVLLKFFVDIIVVGLIQCKFRL